VAPDFSRQIRDDLSLYLRVEGVEAFLGCVVDLFYPVFTEGGEVGRHRSEQGQASAVVPSWAASAAP